jgi:MFS family permease
VWDITTRELDLGLIGLAEWAPAAVLVFVTGSVADRFDKVKVVAASAAVEALTALGLAGYALTDPDGAGPIFGLVIVFGAARAFLAPAGRSLPADVVPPKDLPSLTARRGVAWQLATIIGPVLAGFLYAVDPAVPYVAMAVLLVITTIAALFIRPLPHADEPVAKRSLRDAFEGLRFIRRSPILLSAISLDLFAVLFGGAVALLPAIADERLNVGAVGLGWLRAAGGVGAAVVTLAIAWRPIERHIGRRLLYVVAIFGAATIVLGVTRSYVIAFVSMLVLAGADAVSVFVRSTLVPLATPRDKRGRVTAVEAVFIGASNELGAFESGVIGQAIGAPLAIVTGGAATLGVAAAYWFAFPALRNVDRFPEPVDAIPQ